MKFRTTKRVPIPKSINTFPEKNVLGYKEVRFDSGICFQNIRVVFLTVLILRNFMMRTLLPNTTTAQIPHVRAVPAALRTPSSYAWSLFTLLTGKGFFGLYLYLYLYLYSNDRW